jgi:DNA-binding transcriptional MerR regulator
MARKNERWTIGEIRNLAAAALAVDYNAPGNRQISAIPDARTIRYYGTLGLVDKPAEMRARTAYYGRRHLLQIVAIKRLQAEGLSLAKVQGQLSGLSDKKLESIARLPDDLSASAEELPAEAAPSESPAAGARSEGFWRVPGADASVSPESATRRRPPSTPRLRAHPQLNLELAPGVHVLVDTTRIPDETQRETLSHAAESLLQALRACGLQPQARRPR